MVAPQPEAVVPGGNVRQAWRSSLQRANDVDELSVATLTPAEDGSPVFELVPIEELPAFDAAKTLKTMLLTQWEIRRLNSYRTQWKNVIAFTLQLGNLLMLLTTAAPRRFGSVMAVLAPILQFPGMMFILGSMRIEMLCLLLGTYDFWYFTVNNFIFGVCFIAMLQDIRIIVVVIGCVIVQISIGADALVGDRKQIFLSSVINCGTHFAMFIAVFLKIVDDNDRGDTSLVAYSSSDYGFSIRDTLMNTQLNMIYSLDDSYIATGSLCASKTLQKLVGSILRRATSLVADVVSATTARLAYARRITLLGTQSCGPGVQAPFPELALLEAQPTVGQRVPELEVLSAYKL